MSITLQDLPAREKKRTIEITFLTNARRLRAVVQVIQSNTNTNYITHSEVIEHRAEHTRRWAHFRRSLLGEDIRKAIHRVRRGEGGVLIATKGRSIRGVAVLFFDLKHNYGIIEDIVVDERHRSEGVGRLLLNAACKEMRKAEMENVILESGIRNEGAHEFFKRHGFREAAVMFLKRLEHGD